MGKVTLFLLSLLSLLPLASTGCTYTPSAAYPEEDEPEWAKEEEEIASRDSFRLWVQGAYAINARVTATDITGPSILLSRYTTTDDPAIRGHAFGRPLNVEITKGGASGLFGAGPLTLSAQRSDDTLRVRGLVRGYISNFHVSPRALRGTVATCAYDLVRSGVHYEGRRACRNGFSWVTVTLPDSLLRFNDAEQGTALAVLLGG